VSFSNLLSFILSLISSCVYEQGFQFVTGGFIAGLVGAFQYFSCINVEFPPTCDETGPGASSSFVLEVIEFLGNIVLVWIAFLMLGWPYFLFINQIHISPHFHFIKKQQ